MPLDFYYNLANFFLPTYLRLSSTLLSLFKCPDGISYAQRTRCKTITGAAYSALLLRDSLYCTQLSLKKELKTLQLNDAKHV